MTEAQEMRLALSRAVGKMHDKIAMLKTMLPQLNRQYLSFIMSKINPVKAMINDMMHSGMATMHIHDMLG
jgi:hypothetical protein